MRINAYLHWMVCTMYVKWRYTHEMEQQTKRCGGIYSHPIELNTIVRSICVFSYLFNFHLESISSGIVLNDHKLSDSDIQLYQLEQFHPVISYLIFFEKKWEKKFKTALNNANAR